MKKSLFTLVLCSCLLSQGHTAPSDLAIDAETRTVTARRHYQSITFYAGAEQAQKDLSILTDHLLKKGCQRDSVIYLTHIVQEKRGCDFSMKSESWLAGYIRHMKPISRRLGMLAAFREEECPEARVNAYSEPSRAGGFDHWTTNGDRF